MESIEVSAKTVDEAIELALNQLGRRREEVEVTVIKEGKSGLLGIGAEEAMIEVRPLIQPNVEQEKLVEVAQTVLESLLRLMEVTATTELRQPSPEGAAYDTAPITLDIRGNDLGILIGRHGQTLSSLQHIVRLIVAHQVKAWAPLTIDVEGYKQRRLEVLRELALHLAERAKYRRQPVTLEPMPANERRIIHLTLSDYPGVTTQSIEEGEARKVVILPEINS